MHIICISSCELRTQNNLFRSVRPGDSTLRLVRVLSCESPYVFIYILLMQFTYGIHVVVDIVVYIVIYIV